MSPDYARLLSPPFLKGDRLSVSEDEGGLPSGPLVAQGGVPLQKRGDNGD
jgi:hypothetical protein